ncbi:MAG: site-specific integrase [Micavibrio aeruginosavorus]|uniref:Site-specific integrase n=1 Tax=Micavibrio aeruginosavorus TaxID=349221 RepID=A0A7T5R3H1_9BACT|nr:MAG: site-specific integrase [Micavibrio aeruginosavorus]
MSVYQNKQRKKWCYAFNIDSERYTGYCVNPITQEIATTKRDALKAEKLIRAEIEQRIITDKSKKEEIFLPLPVANSIPLIEPITYRLEQMQNLASFPSAKTYAKEILEFFGEATPMDKVEDRIYLYIEYSKKQNVRVFKGRDKNGDNLYEVKPELRGEKSINEYLKFLTKAYREFKAAPENKKIKHLIPDAPEFKLLKTPKRVPTPIPYNITQTYLEAFDDALHAHTRLAYIICVQTGMRAKECARIRERQYYEAERYISLEAEQTKTATGRYVHVNDIAHQALMECRKIGDYLWEILKQYPHLAAEYQKEYSITARGDINFILYRRKGTGVPRPVKHVATTAWKTTKKAVGIDYRWHDTRAAFCSDTLGADGDIDAVKKLAGHQDIQTTQKYLNAQDPRLKRAVNKLAEHRPLNVEAAKTIKISRKVERALQQNAA